MVRTDCPYTITVYFVRNLCCLINGAKVIQIGQDNVAIIDNETITLFTQRAVYSAVCETLQLAVDDRVHLFAVQLVQVR